MSQSAQPQRFDQSFVVRMIRDFFLVLVVVVLMELLVRFGLVLYRFESEKPQQVAAAAERLAENVRSIMLNRGGPVAARTVYPIIRRNHEEIGLEIAIEPSPITIESIQRRFEETPKGVPADWPEGRYQQAVQVIEAEPFCLQCHVTAGVGDVLGQVTVRGYLADELVAYWEEVRFAGTLGMGKILAHTIILFFLLRVRMESLVSLKGVVSLLAKSGSRLSHRAPVISDDEFGELARDLNLFLERINQVMEDLSAVLSGTSELTERLTDVHRRTEASQGRLDDLARETARDGYEAAAATTLLDPRWLQAAEHTLGELEALAGADTDPVPGDRVEALLPRFRELVAEVERTVSRNREIGANLLAINRELRASAAALEEMAVLEERMRSISARGRTLLERLRGPDGEAPAGADPPRKSPG